MTMIHRDENKDLVIPREDVPALMGIVCGFEEELKKNIAEGKIPGSFMGAFNYMQNFIDRLNKAEED